MKRLFVLGAGGHAKVVLATASAAGWEIAGVLDDDTNCHGQTLLGHTIEGPIARKLADRDATCVLAIGSNANRSALGSIARCSFATLVHPAAFVHGNAELGSGTVVFAGAVIQPDVRVGVHAIINTGSSIDHDCTLGDYVHVAPGVRLAGGVHVDDQTLVGIGATVVPAIRIGAHAIVGAGAVVVRDVPDRTTVIGSPARPLRG